MFEKNVFLKLYAFTLLFKIRYTGRKKFRRYSFITCGIDCGINSARKIDCSMNSVREIHCVIHFARKIHCGIHSTRKIYCGIYIWEFLHYFCLLLRYTIHIPRNRFFVIFVNEIDKRNFECIRSSSPFLQLMQYTAVTIEHRGNAKETLTITRVLLMRKKHQIVWANELRRTSAAGCIVGGGRTLGSKNAKETKKIVHPDDSKNITINKIKGIMTFLFILIFAFYFSSSIKSCGQMNCAAPLLRSPRANVLFHQTR